MKTLQAKLAGLICAWVSCVAIGSRDGVLDEARAAQKPAQGASAKRATAHSIAKKSTKTDVKKTLSKALPRAKSAHAKAAGVVELDGVTILSGGAEFSLPPRPAQAPNSRRASGARAGLVSRSNEPRVSAPKETLAAGGRTSDATSEKPFPYLASWSEARVVGGKFFPPQFTTIDTEGDTINLDQYKGKIVLMDFWGTWCPPSRRETPPLAGLYERYKRSGFEIIGISIDAERDQFERFVSDYRLNWRHIFLGRQWENDILRLYEVESIPETFLLDRDGSVLAIGLRGPELEEAVALAVAGRFPRPVIEEHIIEHE